MLPRSPPPGARTGPPRLPADEPRWRLLVALTSMVRSQSDLMGLLRTASTPQSGIAAHPHRYTLSPRLRSGNSPAVPGAPGHGLSRWVVAASGWIAVTTQSSAGRNHDRPRSQRPLGLPRFHDLMGSSHEGPVERADHAGGPSDGHPADDLGRAQAHQNPRVVRRHEAVSALFLSADDPPSGLDLDARPHGVAGSASPNQGKADPVVSGRRIVAKDRRWTVLVADDQIEVAVVIKVSDRQAMAEVPTLEIGPCTRGRQAKPPAAEVPV